MKKTDIKARLRSGRQFAVLLDPDKHNADSIADIINSRDSDCIDFFLVGGSLVSGSVDETILILKEMSPLPVILFPGSVLQISSRADGILLLSLISGRNPEFLIGNHVIAAPVLSKTALEIIPTGYILVENGRTTSVEYMSDTKPIPADKTDIVIATAMAGEMLGHQLIYLEAGSGARERVNTRLISEVNKNIGIPLMVGGGIHSGEQVLDCYEAGADIVVVGSAVEENNKYMADLFRDVREFRQKV